MTFLFNIRGFTEAWELFTLKHTAMKSFNTTGSGQKDEGVHNHRGSRPAGAARSRPYEGQGDNGPHSKQKGKGNAILRLCEHQCNLAGNERP